MALLVNKILFQNIKIENQNISMNTLISHYKDFNIYLCEKKDKDFIQLYIYVSHNQYNINKISTSKNVISFIHYIYDNKIAQLIFLNTNLKFRNKGFADKILKISIKYLKYKNVEEIELDDMSRNARKKKNIYIKNGFKYINKNPEPEMILNLFKKL